MEQQQQQAISDYIGRFRNFALFCRQFCTESNDMSGKSLRLATETRRQWRRTRIRLDWMDVVMQEGYISVTMQFSLPSFALHERGRHRADEYDTDLQMALQRFWNQSSLSL